MSPIALKIGQIVIYKYSICILLAFVLGYFLALYEAKKRNISKEFITDFLFYVILISIIGARIYYVAFTFDDYKDSLIDVVKIWNGGLAIYGGVIAALIFAIFFTKKRGVNLLNFMDIAAVSLVIGQAIGRWGNFFNQEAYGPITTLSNLKSLPIPSFVIEGMKIDGSYYHPTFFYESMGCLAIFIILLIVRRLKNVKTGTACSIYFIGYGIIRFLIEGLRQDSLMLFNLRISQLVSVALVIAGIVMLILSIKSNKLYKED